MIITHTIKTYNKKTVFILQFLFCLKLCGVIRKVMKKMKTAELLKQLRKKKNRNKLVVDLRNRKMKYKENGYFSKMLIKTKKKRKI